MTLHDDETVNDGTNRKPRKSMSENKPAELKVIAADEQKETVELLERCLNRARLGHFTGVAIAAPVRGGSYFGSYIGDPFYLLAAIEQLKFVMTANMDEHPVDDEGNYLDK